MWAGFEEEEGDVLEFESRVGAKVGDSPIWKEGRDTARQNSRRKEVRMTEHTCPRPPLWDFGRCDLGIEQHPFLEHKVLVPNSQLFRSLFFFPCPLFFSSVPSRESRFQQLVAAGHNIGPVVSDVLLSFDGSPPEKWGCAYVGA